MDPLHGEAVIGRAKVMYKESSFKILLSAGRTNTQLVVTNKRLIMSSFGMGMTMVGTLFIGGALANGILEHINPRKVKQAILLQDILKIIKDKTTQESKWSEIRIYDILLKDGTKECFVYERSTQLVGPFQSPEDFENAMRTLGISVE